MADFSRRKFEVAEFIYGINFAFEAELKSKPEK